MGFIYVNSTGNVTLANSTTETSLLGSTFTLPASQAVVGQTFRAMLRGELSTNVVAPTLRMRVLIGSTAVMDTAAFTLPTLSAAGVWDLDLLLTFTSTGGAATYQAYGRLFLPNSTAAVLAAANIVGVSPTGTAVNLTIDNTFDVKATWGTANALNTITQKVAVIEMTAV